MYALLSIVLFLIGTGLIVIVLVRKMPALVDLPGDQPSVTREFFGRVKARLKRIDWPRYQRLALTVLAAAVDFLRRLFFFIARQSERFAKLLRGRIRKLSGQQPIRAQFSFFSRIRRRSAFVEEERRLIEQLTENPHDVDAYRRLGNLYAIAGNVADARAAFTELLRLAPEDEEAKQRLTELGDSFQETAKES
ncbi:MAG: tetratricopeptide repeat protein [Candidatus Terrybacteria bacterium]|nr:tetratricopeptide repeat protein [Candidatus Terrybacteria bacterium]